METKLNRIAAFIDSLPAESMVGESSSMVLTSQLDVVGGSTDATNESTCENKSINCYTSQNQKQCINVGLCGEATNKAGCSTIDPPITDNSDC